jgi:purine-cytosine permease-like protein
MIVLFGPCMFVAPLLILLVPIALVLWPPVLVVLGALWLVMWPFAAIGRRYGVRWLVSSHATLGRWFAVLLRPWRYFDPPRGANPPG